MSSRTHTSPRSIKLLALLVLGLGLSGSSATADSTAESVVDPPRVAGASPAAETAGSATAPAVGTAAAATPRTRAEVKARIASIDPGDWLTRFGAVEQRAAASR